MDDGRRKELEQVLVKLVAHLQAVEEEKRAHQAGYATLIKETKDRLARISRALQTGDDSICHEEGFGGSHDPDSELN